MKKRLFVITALSAAMTVSGLPVHAAELRPVLQGKGYTVYIGQECGNLEETLANLGIDLDFDKIFCPEVPDTEEPEVPDTEVPEVPDTEEPEVPDTEEPEVPDTGEPEVPDTEVPEVPGTQKPDTDIPEAPVQPGGTDNGTTGQPDTDISDEDSLHEYAREVVALVNEERVKAGLSELKLDMDVTAAADIRAREIVQSFSHTRPDGSSFSTALQQQGVSYRGSGENIAWGQRTPQQVMEGWMNSDGHRANILNKNYTNIGVGFYQKNGVNYWVQLFTY